MATRSNSPYVPSFIKSLTYSRPVQGSYSDFNLTDSNHGNTGSFKYDALDFPLKSTQQLNVDWSKFEHHCFFSSAEVKVNEAFNKVINGYPFDGTKKEVEAFLDSLTGFEKYVFDSFPEWSGALHFSGTQVGEDPAGGYPAGLGTWISVKDKSGVLFPEIAKNDSGATVINPTTDDSLSLEALVYLPQESNDTQIVLQKTATPTQGFTFHIEPSAATTSAMGVFSVSSGSFRNNVSAPLTKGKFNHICLTLNKETRENSLQFYVNETLKSESTSQVRFGDLGTGTADMLIGSGSTFYSDATLVTPTQTFSGSIDELRVYHSVRDVKQQKTQITRGAYATPDLKLYYRFNEPSGSLSLNGNVTFDSIVLDSSGNSLHATVNNFNDSLREDVTSYDPNVMQYEKKEFQKVLFPAYSDVILLNSSLLAAAKEYDRNNPNNILRLVPQHYLLEGASQDGFGTIEGDGGQPYGGEGIPGQGKRGSVQIILSFLYVWAKHFDELKMFIDAFVTLRSLDYDEEDTIPDNFLQDIVRYYGFTMPTFFNNATVEQFAEGQNIDGLTDVTTPLKKIQAILLRRVLINMKDIVSSKGTQHSIRSFLRSIGIDPENSLRIREYGGSTTIQLGTTREKRTSPGAMVEFTTSSLVTSTPLSASRVEPGYPQPRGVFLSDPTTGRNTGTTYAADGLLTSGSWNMEAVFKIPPQKMSIAVDTNGNQSLFRIVTTGSFSSAEPALLVNVVATPQSTYPKIPASVKAFIRPGMSTTSPMLTIDVPLSGAGIFDGDKWNVAVGCFRNDEIGSIVSSSYYLRAGKNDSGDLSEVYLGQGFLFEQPVGEGNAFRTLNTSYNASGSIIELGSGRTYVGSPTYPFLNDTLNVDPIARSSDYVGRAGNLRFWSKGMSVEEWKEHARNPKSVGVDDPLRNYNFVRNVSGSFQKLRLDVLQKQPTKNADNSGDITFLDFSLNSSDAYGTGFQPDDKVLVGDVFQFSYLSPHFDEASTEDKIRIRSFNDPHLVNENAWAVDAPTYLSTGRLIQEEPLDDTRLSIEFSMVDSLDVDIISMFSSFDVMNDALGSPELMFSPDYPDLDRLRDVYFNRLSGKPDFRKFLEFYRWFDANVSTFVEQLIPSRTNYKGTNFVVESHLLERHKRMYHHSGNYVGQRRVINDSLLVQQIVGKLKKY